jgi:hypothetical protein
MPTLAELFLLSSQKANLQVECPQLTIVLQDVYEMIVLNRTSSLQSLHSTATNQTQLDDQETTWKGPELRFTSGRTYYICKSCETATLLWSRTSQGQVLGKERLLQALKSYLESTDFINDWLHIPGAQLWCLVVGIYVSRENGRFYSWFVSRLSWSWSALSLCRWKELQRSLAWFGWILRGTKSPVVLSS